MPRVPVFDYQSGGDDAKRFVDAVLQQRKSNVFGGRLPNLFGGLLNRPNIAEAFLNFGTVLRQRGVLDDRAREMATLQVARLNRTAHLWRGQLHQSAAGRAD